MSKRKILMIVAPENFRDEEYLKPCEVFEKKGYSVKVASKDVDIAHARFGAKVNVDLDITEIESEDYTAIVFVGGGGALVYENNLQIHKIIQDFKASKKLIAALCIAPRILGAAGILVGKKVTMWNGDTEQQSIIESTGAIFTNTDVEQDGLIITANGPQVARQFAEKIIVAIER